MSVPTKEEFFAPLSIAGEDNFSPDMQWAWKNFGGKTLDEAYAFFSAHPDEAQEDFMWMPEGAFRYYFPVVDRYVRSLERPPEWEWFLPLQLLPACLQMHIDGHEDLSGLHEPILALCDYVCTHLVHFAADPAEQDEIGRRWTELRTRAMEAP